MSEKINTRALSGFVELLPREQAVFDAARGEIEKIYRNNGYCNMDTPAIERAETLFAKSAGETEKQIYRVSHGDTAQALRFDLTIPFARYVADHYGELVFPFKRYAIDKVWRGERAQKGRYREFYQADIDAVGEGQLDAAYDADVIATLSSVVARMCEMFGLGAHKVRLGNRKVWNDAGLADLPAALALLDKRLKMSEEEFEAALSKLPDAAKVRKVLGRGGADCDDLQRAVELLRAAGVPFEVDLSIVRGLDYYTGNVFETFIEGYESVGSVASGGRYDNLCSHFIDKNIVGVGGSFGLTRFLAPLIGSGKGPAALALDAVILPMGERHYAAAMKLERMIAKRARASAMFVSGKLKKLLEKADKLGARYAIIIGDDEAAAGECTLKNMQSGEQKRLGMDAAAAEVSK